MISIILDTNTINPGCKDFTKACFVDKVNPILDEIESNDLYEKVQVLLPQIVVDELYQRQCSEFVEQQDTILNFRFPHINIVKFDDDYKNYLKKIFDISIQEISNRDAKCMVIPYPKNDCLQSIICRAIEKKAPFEGKKGNSDKGFKDVLIWESLLEYKRDNQIDSIILYSGDERLCHKSLANEYKKLFNDDLHVVNRDSKCSCYADLYDKLRTLTGENIKLTFEERLKQRVLSLMRPINLNCYFEGQEIEVDYDDNYVSHICDSIDVGYTEIKKVYDIKNEGKIRFEIIVSGICYYEVCDDDIGSNTLTTEFSEYCRFTVEYRNSDNMFYMIEVIIFGGDVECVDDSEPLIEADYE